MSLIAPLGIRHPGLTYRDTFLATPEENLRSSFFDQRHAVTVTGGQDRIRVRALAIQVNENDGFRQSPLARSRFQRFLEQGRVIDRLSRAVTASSATEYWTADRVTFSAVQTALMRSHVTSTL